MKGFFSVTVITFFFSDVELSGSTPYQSTQADL